MFIELLSDMEKKTITHMRHLGIEENDFTSGSFVDNESFLRFWEEAKQNMAKVFGKSLILKKRVSVTAETQDLHDDMARLITSYEYQYVYDSIKSMLGRSYDLTEIFHIHDNRSARDGQATSLFHELKFYMFSSEALIANKYEGATLELKLSDGSVFKLVNGCKLMKAMGRLARVAKVEHEFEHVRIKQSQIMNEANLSADLCLSIHPLDYFTASYNESGWHSCMNWEDGDYRRGVIEMMNSPYVVVAYLESDHDYLDFSWSSSGSWNSKKWREFFIVSPYGIYGIKGYPYWNRNLEDMTLLWLRELFNSDERAYSKNIVSWHVGSSIQDATVNSDVMMRMMCGPAMYNDFYSSNDYHAILPENCVGNHLLNYSGESECIICGEEGEFNDPSNLGCVDCVESHSCCRCGDLIDYYSDLVEFHGRDYCRYCYAYLPRCTVCGEPIDEENDPASDGIRFCIGDAESDIVIKDSDGEPIFRAVCGDCASQVFYRGETELITRHPSYLRCWYSDPLMPISSISNLDALHISSEFVQNFRERLKAHEIRQASKFNQENEAC